MKNDADYGNNKYLSEDDTPLDELPDLMEWDSFGGVNKAEFADDDDQIVWGGNPADTVPDLAAYGCGLDWDDFNKDSPDARIWLTGPAGALDGGWFSFDRKKLYSLFADARDLTGEERQIFIEEMPYWADFFGMQAED